MDEDTEQAAWAQQELESRELQEQLAADPGYLDWLIFIEARASHEQEYEQCH